MLTAFYWILWLAAGAWLLLTALALGARLGFAPESRAARALLAFNRAAFPFVALALLVAVPAPTTFFTLEKPAASPPAAVAPGPETDARLQAAADALLPLFGSMPPVPVYVVDDPVVKGGTNTERGVAYTHCEGHERPSVYLKKDFAARANQKQLVNILKHELTHAWLCRRRLMNGHDERFKQKFKEVGGFGN